MVEPSGENTTLRTQSACPSIGSPICAYVAVSQRRMLPSAEPDTSFFPSGENTALITPSVCPSKTATHLRDTEAHIRMVPSSEPLAMVRPSGEKVKLPTQSVCRSVVCLSSVLC